MKKVCDVVPTYDMNTLLGDLKGKVGKESIYIQHVEGTAFTTEQMTMEI